MKDQIVIDGIEYIRKPDNSAIPLSIVVMDKGFVYIGRFEETKGGWFRISDARNIRIWGTTGVGLGALKDGPLKDTVLDDVGIVTAPNHSLVMLIDIDQGAWG